MNKERAEMTIGEATAIWAEAITKTEATKEALTNAVVRDAEKALTAIDAAARLAAEEERTALAAVRAYMAKATN